MAKFLMIWLNSKIDLMLRLHYHLKMKQPKKLKKTKVVARRKRKQPMVGRKKVAKKVKVKREEEMTMGHQQLKSIFLKSFKSSIAFMMITMRTG